MGSVERWEGPKPLPEVDSGRESAGEFGKDLRAVVRGTVLDYRADLTVDDLVIALAPGLFLPEVKAAMLMELVKAED